LKQQIESAHNGIKLLKYTICADSFEQESSIHQHKEYVHIAMHLTNVNFVMEDLIENFFSISILNHFMSEINNMKETFGM
jgi:predicted methyltransferase